MPSPPAVSEEPADPVDLLRRDDERRQERTVASEVAFSRMPASSASDATCLASPARRSTAAISPRRRTSVATPAARRRPSHASSRAPSTSTRSKSPGSSSRSRTASAAAATTGPPPNVDPWSPVPRHAFGPTAHDGRAHGQTAAQRLGHGDDVGLDAVALVGERRAAAAETRLHLVQHEERVVLRAQALAPRSRNSAGSGCTPDSPNTGSAMNAATGRWSKTPRERVDVADGHVEEALGTPGTNGSVLLGLPGRVTASPSCARGTSARG